MEKWWQAFLQIDRGVQLLTPLMLSAKRLPQAIGFVKVAWWYLWSQEMRRHPTLALRFYLKKLQRSKIELPFILLVGARNSQPFERKKELAGFRRRCLSVNDGLEISLNQSDTPANIACCIPSRLDNKFSFAESYLSLSFQSCRRRQVDHVLAWVRLKLGSGFRSMVTIKSPKADNKLPKWFGHFNQRKLTKGRLQCLVWADQQGCTNCASWLPLAHRATSWHHYAYIGLTRLSRNHQLIILVAFKFSTPCIWESAVAWLYISIRIHQAHWISQK
jgi:hypothetical protein